MSRTRSHSMSKKAVAWTFATILLLGIGAAAVVVGSTSGASAPQIAVLDRAPAVLGQGPLPTDAGLGLVPDLSQARLAYSRNGEQVFVVPGRDNQVCLISASAAGIGTTCAVPGTTPLAPAIGLGAPQSDGSVRIRAILPDGFTSALVAGNRIPIEGNILVFTLPPGIDRVEVAGPSGPVAIPFGNLRASTGG